MNLNELYDTLAGVYIEGICSQGQLPIFVQFSYAREETNSTISGKLLLIDTFLFSTSQMEYRLYICLKKSNRLAESFQRQMFDFVVT